MREGFIQTVIGEVPEHWKAVKVGDILNITTGNKNAQDAVGDGQYPFFTRSVKIQRINTYSYDTEALFIAGEGNFKLKYYAGKFDVHQRTYILTRLKSVEVNLVFLKDIIDSKIEKLISTSVGSTVQSLRKPIIANLIIPLPPLPEQQKIAEILSTIDQKIEVIDEQIKQTQELQKGLMQRLLSKGIGHTQFTDSPLGKIPISWEVVLLDSVSKRGSGHTPSKNYPEHYDGGIKWVSLADSNRLDNRWIGKTKVEISEAGIKNSSAVLHPKGTVLMSRDASVGRSAIMQEDMAVSQHFITWTCSIKLINWFLYYYLQKSKPLFERIAAGSTIKTIGLPFFKKLQIPLPPIEEQTKIAEILYSVDDKLDVLLEKKIAYQELKKGLMQQLLTGKLRVNQSITESALL